jgi:hypothetical protein
MYIHFVLFIHWYILCVLNYVNCLESAKLINWYCLVCVSCFGKEIFSQFVKEFPFKRGGGAASGGPNCAWRPESLILL